MKPMNRVSDTSINNMIASTADQRPTFDRVESGSGAPGAVTTSNNSSMAGSIDRYLYQQPNQLLASSSADMPSRMLDEVPLVTPVYTKSSISGGIASIFAQPSPYLQHALRHKAVPGSINVESSNTKRQRIVEAAFRPLNRQDGLLHQACCLPDPPNELIQRLLLNDSTAASRAMSSAVNAEPSCATTGTIYSYPINLAIQHHAKPEVLSLLINAAPQVLALPDGPFMENSLHLLMRFMPNDKPTVLLMLLSQPALASRMDRYQNYPLHVACQHNANADIVQYLCLVCPDACAARNQQGHMPKDLMLLATKR